MLRWISSVLFFLFLIVAPSFSQASGDKQTQFASHLQKARSFLDQKRPDLAIPELKAAEEIDPKNVEVQANLGVLLYFQGKAAEAVPHLQIAVMNQPGMGKIQGLLGLAELRTLDTSAGRKDLEAAFPLITEEKFKIEVGLQLVSVCTEAGDLDEAGALLAQLKKLAPESPEVLYAAYRTYSDLAGESMIALSVAAPESAQMHQMLAHEENKQGNTNRAVENLKKAITIDPRLPGAHFELAEMLRASSDPAVKKQAEAEYQAALKDNPQDEKSVLRLAEIAAERGDKEQAHKGYARAAELQPGDPDAKLGLAKTLISMDKKNEALKLLEEAVQLEPTNATAHYRLGTLYREMGRADEAKKEIELYKKYKDLKEKLQALYKELQVQPKEISVSEAEEK